MRARRFLASFAAVLVLVAAAAWLLLKYSPEVTLVFTQAQLQAQLEPRFPARKCVLGACIELLDPRVSLTEGSDLVGIDTRFVATFGRRAMPGFVQFSGRPHYEQDNGKFYLHDVEVTRFEMSGNAPDFDEVVRVRGPGIVAAIMDRFPLYSVQSHPKYGAVARHAVRSVRVLNGELQVVFVNPLLILGG